MSEFESEIRAKFTLDEARAIRFALGAMSATTWDNEKRSDIGDRLYAEFEDLLKVNE